MIKRRVVLTAGWTFWWDWTLWTTVNRRRRAMRLLDEPDR